LTYLLSEREGEVAVCKEKWWKPWCVIKGVFMSGEQLEQLLKNPAVEESVRKTILDEVSFIRNVVGKDIGYLVRIEVEPTKEITVEEVIAIIKVYYEPDVTAIYGRRIYPPLQGKISA